MQEIASINGHHVYREDNGVGGHRYWTDAVGDGVVVWDTSLVSIGELETSIAHAKQCGYVSATTESVTYSVGFKLLMDDIARFHQAATVPLHASPVLPAQDRMHLRYDLIHEEVVRELLPAIINRDLYAIADGCIDSIVVIVGTLLECGIPGHVIWQIVHNANMAKVDSSTGKIKYRADGKILKPDGWADPHPTIHKVIDDYATRVDQYEFSF